MRVAVIFATLAASSAVVTASPLSFDLGDLLGIDLDHGNHYGAPIPPWNPGAHPGWYFGNHPGRHPRLTCLMGLLCRVLKKFPHALQCPTRPPGNPPPPSDGYTQTFANLTGATQAGDYLTFGLVETVADCKVMCDSVQGCHFANSYRDVNGKDGSPLLTCSLWGGCHTTQDATNTGGQTQPDGSVNYITNSDGWCKA